MHEEDCPLLAVAVLGRTPAPWTEANPGGLRDRYRCAEFTPVRAACGDDQ